MFKSKFYDDNFTNFFLHNENSVFYYVEKNFIDSTMDIISHSNFLSFIRMTEIKLFGKYI